MIKKAFFTICLAILSFGVAEKVFSQGKFTVDKVIANVGNGRWVKGNIH